MKHYRLGEPLPLDECCALKLKESMHARAVPTGELRPPKRGEWYLSGSIVQAYRARNNLGTPYRIAKIVVMRKVEKWEVVS